MQLLPPFGCCAAVNKPVLYIWHDFYLPLAIYSFYNLPCYRSSVANCCFMGICSTLDIWCRITGQNGRGAQRILQPKFIICVVPELWSVPNRSLNSQSYDNKTGSSTSLLDISMASTPLGSNHGLCWHPHPINSHGWGASAFSPSPCWWSHNNETMVLHVSPCWTPCDFQSCVTDGSGQGNLPFQMKPHNEMTGNVDSPQHWHHCSSPSASSQSSISPHYSHHDRHGLMPVLHQSHTQELWFLNLD